MEALKETPLLDNFCLYFIPYFSTVFVELFMPFPSKNVIAIASLMKHLSKHISGTRASTKASLEWENFQHLHFQVTDLGWCRRGERR